MHSSRDPALSGHTLTSSIQYIENEGSNARNLIPFMLMGLWFIFAIVYLLMTCAGKVKKRELAQAEDEKLIAYSLAMPDSERHELLKVEEYFAKKYKMQTLTAETTKRLKEADDVKPSSGKIEDEPSYRIDQMEDY
jgi:hypothetical protein